jgi:hypothetical protein
MSVNERGFDLLIPQQFLDERDIRTKLVQVRGITVSQTVNADLFTNARLVHGLLENSLNAAPVFAGCAVSVTPTMLSSTDAT